MNVYCGASSVNRNRSRFVDKSIRYFINYGYDWHLHDIVSTGYSQLVCKLQKASVSCFQNIGSVKQCELQWILFSLTSSIWSFSYIDPPRTRSVSGKVHSQQTHIYLQYCMNAANLLICWRILRRIVHAPTRDRKTCNEMWKLTWWGQGSGRC